MYEWNRSVQAMIDWIEAHLCDSPTLLEMSGKIGYSPCYCSAKFHEIVGMTIKSYLSARRLARAAIDIRDTKKRILDIALQYGYSSQEALTRAFCCAYGCTPAVYRKAPRPVPYFNAKVVVAPYQFEKGAVDMQEPYCKEAAVRMEFIPAHQYVGIWDDTAENYGEFWETHDCDCICGMIESMRHISHPVVGSHMAGWRWADGRRKYFYGFGVPLDYKGEIPEGFSARPFRKAIIWSFSIRPLIICGTTTMSWAGWNSWHGTTILPGFQKQGCVLNGMKGSARIISAITLRCWAMRCCARCGSSVDVAIKGNRSLPGWQAPVARYVFD